METKGRIKPNVIERTQLTLNQVSPWSRSTSSMALSTKLERAKIFDPWSVSEKLKSQVMTLQIFDR